MLFIILLCSIVACVLQILAKHEVKLAKSWREREGDERE